MTHSVPPKPALRTARLSALVQEKIASLIVEGKIKDPRVHTALSITRVEVARDLSYADVFVSTYENPVGLEKGVEGLQSAAGFIQAKLAATMHIRQTPKLRFHADTAFLDAFALNQKIDSLCAEAPAANAT